MKKSDPPIEVTHNFDCKSEVLWKALTDINEMKKWFFDNIPEFKPEVGFSTSFMVSNEERTFTHQWKVLESIPNKKIKYSWSYTEYEGDGYVEFIIETKGKGSQLKFKNTVTEDYPQDIPEFKLESCQAGWNYFIKERLDQYIHGN